MDAADGITLTGEFLGTISFGSTPLTSAGDYDIFVAKLAPDGEHMGSHRFGGHSLDRGSGVALDSGGRAVVIGEFQGRVDFGGSTLNSAGNNDWDICVFTVAP